MDLVHSFSLLLYFIAFIFLGLQSAVALFLNLVCLAAVQPSGELSRPADTEAETRKVHPRFTAPANYLPLILFFPTSCCGRHWKKIKERL